ncbi:MAG: DUF5119 domain-containing protein [Rikenellaceae bacterium]
MKIYIKYSLTILTSALFCCKRQDLVSPFSDYINVPISVDWSNAALTDDYANSFSVYFFPKYGEEPYIKIAGSVDSTNVQLPAGEYSILIFNDFINDLFGIKFAYETAYSEFTASAILGEDTDGYFADIIDSDQEIVTVNDRLAAWRQDDFIVYDNGCGYCNTTETSSTTSESLLGIQPTPVTAQNTINLRVENLDNAQLIVGVLKGAATAAYLSTNQRYLSTSSEYIYTYTFLSKIYDDELDSANGVASATLTTFGKQPTDDTSYELELKVILNSGELMTFTRDVTSQINGSEDFDIIINLTDSENLITLPESQSIGIGVESWGDSEDVNLI